MGLAFASSGVGSKKQTHKRGVSSVTLIQQSTSGDTEVEEDLGVNKDSDDTESSLKVSKESRVEFQELSCVDFIKSLHLPSATTFTMYNSQEDARAEFKWSKLLPADLFKIGQDGNKFYIWAKFDSKIENFRNPQCTKYYFFREDGYVFFH